MAWFSWIQVSFFAQTSPFNLEELENNLKDRVETELNLLEEAQKN